MVNKQEEGSITLGMGSNQSICEVILQLFLGLEIHKGNAEVVWRIRIWNRSYQGEDRNNWCRDREIEVNQIKWSLPWPSSV